MVDPMLQERPHPLGELSSAPASNIDEDASSDPQMVCLRLTSLCLVLLGGGLILFMAMMWYQETFTERKRPHPDPIYDSDHRVQYSD